MIVLANVISFAGCILMVAIGLMKDRRKILGMQCVQWVIMGISNLMLGGVTGFISNMISTVRNLYTLKRDLTQPVKWMFIAVQVVVSAAFNGIGWIGWLPIVAAVVFTLFLDQKDERVLKCSIIFGQILWAVFDLSLMNYTAFAFDVFTIISTAIGLVRISREKTGKGGVVLGGRAENL